MKYNGWTNYETWRIALEVFDGYEPEESDLEYLEDSLRETAEAVVLHGVKEHTIAHGLLVSFLLEVNFREIAENLTNN